MYPTLRSVKRAGSVPQNERRCPAFAYDLLQFPGAWLTSATVRLSAPGPRLRAPRLPPDFLPLHQSSRPGIHCVVCTPVVRREYCRTSFNRAVPIIFINGTAGTDVDQPWTRPQRTPNLRCICPAQRLTDAWYLRPCCYSRLTICVYIRSVH